MSDTDLAPALLVAMPQLVDPNFRGAVILVVHHDSEGTFGLVVNRPTDLSVESLCDSLDIGWSGSNDVCVSWGGPVQPDHGWIVLGGAEPDQPDVRVVADEIGVSSSPDVLRSVAEDPPERLRLFLGYAGWGPGQLAQEIAQGSWIVAPLESRFVFDGDPDSCWSDVLAGLGINPATLVQSQGIN